MNATFGHHWIWIVKGLQEAAERAAIDGSYQWIRVAPFLMMHKANPNAADNDSDKGFMKIATEIRQLAGEALEMAARQVCVCVNERMCVCICARGLSYCFPVYGI
jgi:hypothetical protein